MPRSYAKYFYYRQEVKDMRILRVDLERSRITLIIDDIKTVVEKLPGMTPIEELRIDSVVSGTVRSSSDNGVFVDIGAARHGRLELPRRANYLFRRNMELSDMIISSIDYEKGLFSLEIVGDPMAAVAQAIGWGTADAGDGIGSPHLGRGGGPQGHAPAGAAAAQTGARTGTGGRGNLGRGGGAVPPPARRPVAARAAPPAATTGMKPLCDFHVGDSVDGVITGVSSRNAFVDIGCSSYARLVVPDAAPEIFQVGDHVHGMVVEEVDTVRDQVVVSLEDPELEVDPMPPPPPRATGRGGSKRRARSAPRGAGRGGADPRVAATGDARPRAAVARGLNSASSNVPRSASVPRR
eukprot:NODE_7682_length_1558_cov_4.218029.p1 GENE.NODE_7682_length_1558_cov_4.218029~~NODE_7682_length_1558_cov_4.218029.p1  ORF type:complete len:375 (-),score=126.77 NODE_7682_length_1558_cov_4.218029:432-1487(-)